MIQITNTFDMDEKTFETYASLVRTSSMAIFPCCLFCKKQTKNHPYTPFLAFHIAPNLAYYIYKNKSEKEATKMSKLTKKELAKLSRQMGISTVQHDRPPVGRPAVFYGTTNKQRRKEGKKAIREYYG